MATWSLHTGSVTGNAVTAGIGMAAAVAIADTIGGGNPQQMKQIMAPLIRDFGADRFYVHLHDTRGLAAAMAWEAADLGVRRFDASLGGLGG